MRVIPAFLLPKFITIFILGLQNDHKALMRQIEAGLQNYYSPMNGQIDSVNGHTEVESNSQERTQIVTHQIPFARVTEVRPTSPAEFCVCVLYIYIIKVMSKIIKHYNWTVSGFGGK